MLPLAVPTPVTSLPITPELVTKFDIFLSLPTTSPLRNNKDILSALQSFDSNTDMVVSITKAARSPWFNMVEKNKDGFLEILMQHEQTIIRRQDSPKIFDLTTVAYVTRPEFIMGANGIFGYNDLWVSIA